MGIKVPTASEAGVGQVKATPLNTPDQRLQTDDDMFGGAQARGLVQGAQDLDNASNSLMNAAVKIRSREDTILRTRARSSFYEKHFGELNRIQSEEDLTDPQVVARFKQNLQQDMSKVISEHVGTDDSKARLSAALEEMRVNFTTEASRKAIEGQKKLLDQHMETQMRGLTARAKDPSASLSDLFVDIDKYIDDAAPGLYPEQEAQWSDIMRQSVIISKVEAFTHIGAYEEARDLIAENPFISQILDRQQQKTLSNTINAGLRARDQAFREGLNVRNKLRGILGREPTQAEIMQSAGLKTDSYKPLSEQGKQSWDRQYLVSVYGEGSAQVRDFDTSIQDDEMTSQQKNFAAAQRDGFNGSFIDYVNATRTTLEKTPTGFEYDTDGNLQYIKGGPADPNAKAYAERVKAYPQAKNALNSLIMQTDFIKKRIADARKLINPYSTGWGIKLDGMPGADARSLKNVLETLKSNIILDTMKTLKASGTTMGQQSDAENQLLAAAKGVFDPAQRDQLEKNLDELEKSYIGYTKHITEAFNTDFADMIGKEGAEAMQGASNKVTDTDYIFDVSGQIIPRAGQKAEQSQTPQPARKVEIPIVGGKRVNVGDIIEDGQGQWRWNGSGWDKLESDEERMDAKEDLGVNQ